MALELYLFIYLKYLSSQVDKGTGIHSGLSEVNELNTKLHKSYTG